MKLFLITVAVAFLASANGATFELGDCIKMDVDSVVTVTASRNGQTELSAKVDMSDLPHTISGNCSAANASSVTMKVTFNNMTDWVLLFAVSQDGRVNLDQSLLFKPEELFKNASLTSDVVSVVNSESMALSLDNSSYACDSQQTVDFTPNTRANYSFSATQVLSKLQVQAFGLHNGTYSPAERCSDDEPTTVSTPTTATTPTTTPEPQPTVPPVAVQKFVLGDAQGQACFRLNAGLQFLLEYNTTNNTMVFSQPIAIKDTAKVTGTCGNTTATMVITSSDSVLEIMETLSKDEASSTIKLSVTLDSANFPNAAAANSTVVFEMVDKRFQQSKVDTFYVCNVEQAFRFNNESRTTLYANNVQLQAFNLNNGSFTGAGDECSLDPVTTPAPTTPAPTPDENKYVVTGVNKTCIVMLADITFSNITYNKVYFQTGSQDLVKVSPISIPTMNATSGNVKVSGNCSMEDGNAQQLVITFNSNWTLSLTFARLAFKASSMLTASDTDYSLRDIELVYYLTADVFPNATQPNLRQTSAKMNITSDFLKSSADGGSYKCSAKVTETLGEGVVFETTNLQYKAFNNNTDTTFDSNKVSECAADDESNSIVPIAVGAALAGLVVIVLIAYFIGRRRSRRTGYESV